MNLPHQGFERDISRFEIGICDVGQPQSLMLVLAANHVDFALAKRTFAVKKDLELVVAKTFGKLCWCVFQEIHVFSKTFNSFTVIPSEFVRDNCQERKNCSDILRNLQFITRK